MTSNGTRGANFEREVRAVLVNAGYVVIRSTASKTGVDLVALWDRPGAARWWTTAPVERWALPILIVQAKTDGRLDPGEWNLLHGLAVSSGGHAVLVSRTTVGRRKVPAFYVLTGRKVSGARNAPKVRVYPPEVPR